MLTANHLMKISNGLNLGEGAGYVVLVSEKIASQFKKEMYCELKGYANANDAYHQTASSPEGNGPYLAMQQALQTCTTSARQILITSICMAPEHRTMIFQKAPQLKDYSIHIIRK